jgi:hypothetical protein
MEMVKQYEEFKSIWGKDLAKKKKMFDFTTIYISEYEKNISKLIAKNIKLNQKKGNFDFKFPTENNPELLCKRLYMENENLKEELKEWIFITINPKPDIKLEDFINKIKSLTKWKIFQKGYYVFEQRGENDASIGDGFHAHIMLENYSIEWKRLHTRLETTFTNYCSKPYKNTINIQRKSPEHGRETLEEYMKGIKEEEKDLKCKYDIIWRKNNSIKDIYFWDIATDKDIPKSGTDGRVSNGGKRPGSGRKKKEIIKEEKENIDVKNNVFLEF